MGSVPNCRREIAVRYPIRWFKCKLKPPKKQEDEILTHLVKLTRDKRNDTVRLSASVPEARQVLDPSHPWYKYDDSA